MKTEGAKRDLSKGRPQMGTPRDMTIHHQGTNVPLGHVVLSGGLLVPARCVTSGALLTPEG